MIYADLVKILKETRPDIDLQAVQAAYDFAERYHEGQTRYSGEPYIVHPVGASYILLSLNPDLAALQACLLHDVTEDTEATYEDVEAAFGEEIADLVQGCEKLALVKVKEGAQDEQWKNMFLAMAKDIRIVFIKLADRLHNMRTLHHVPEEKRYRIAHESMVVHAAIASRLGIYQIKSELEDLCFRYLHPEEYEELSEKMEAYQVRSEECMAYATSQIEQLVFREGIVVEKVTGRLKHLWSLYQKMKKKDTTVLEDIYDLFAVRIVLPDDMQEDQEQFSHLYSTLGVLHNEYLPIQDRFKDYVAMPKPNGYRSLHTTVLDLGGGVYEEPTEIQIRTVSMHREAEIGIASHWRYKGARGMDPRLSRRRHFQLHAALNKVHALVQEFPEIEGSVKEWVERYQHLSLEDRAKAEKVLREKGLIDEDFDHIRKGRSQENLSLSPNVDQQLAWLRELGENEAEVGELDLYPDSIFVLTPGRDVKKLPRGATPIDFAYLIHTDLGNQMAHAKVNGRIVPFDHELRNGDIVEVGTRKGAKPSQYWLSIAKTSGARAKIRSWLAKQEKETSPVKEAPIEEPKLAAPKKREQENTAELSHQEITKRVLITGEDNLPVVLSACCKPRPPHSIIGYVTRGQNIRVHRLNCRELSGLEGQRFISAHWRPTSSSPKPS